MSRKGKGRQRVEMVKMKNESNLQVTFSKRRFGLFKKANELVTLCGAEVALIVFSPGQKVFSFGHPSVEIIIDKYINRNSHFGYHNSDRLFEAHRMATIRELTSELSHIEHLLDVEKNHAEILNKRVKNCPIKHWWETPIDELTPQQLEQLKASLEGLKKDVDEEVHKFMVQSANTNPYILESGFFGRNVAAFSAGFNRAFTFAAQEGEVITAMVQQNPRASGASSSSMSHGIDISYGRRYF